MSIITLENEYMQIDVLNTEDLQDEHFFSRYNFCGYIKQITLKERNTELLTSPLEKFRPYSGEGFPDEFEMPLGYDEANVGEEFVKIGVGAEIKKADVQYTNRDMHKVSKTAATEITSVKASEIVYHQTFNLGTYGYDYKKIISLDKEKLIITHSLTNIGDKDLHTVWYSHAFLSSKFIENKAVLYIPNDYKLKKETPSIVKNDNCYVISSDEKTLKGECFNWIAQGQLNNFQILKNKYGKCLYHADGNFSVYELQVFINDKVISIEPKKNILISRGQVDTWQTIYTLKGEF